MSLHKFLSNGVSLFGMMVSLAVVPAREASAQITPGTPTGRNIDSLNKEVEKLIPNDAVRLRQQIDSLENGNAPRSGQIKLINTLRPIQAMLVTPTERLPETTARQIQEFHGHLDSLQKAGAPVSGFPPSDAIPATSDNAQTALARKTLNRIFQQHRWSVSGVGMDKAHILPDTLKPMSPEETRRIQEKIQSMKDSGPADALNTQTDSPIQWFDAVKPSQKSVPKTGPKPAHKKL